MSPALLPTTEEEYSAFRCRTCQLVHCHVCGDRPRSAFEAAALRHGRSSQNVRCIDCSHPQCSNPGCKTCKRCRSEACSKGDACVDRIHALNPTLQPRNMEEKLAFRCTACQLVRCHICGDRPRDAFDVAALRHGHNTRNVRCIDCSHPECSRPGCKTCTKCRMEACSLGDKCSGHIQPLHPKQQPKDLGEKFAFRCQTCRYPPCQRCGKPMPKGNKSRYDKSGHMAWTCADCLTLELSHQDLAKKRRTG